MQPHQTPTIYAPIIDSRDILPTRGGSKMYGYRQSSENALMTNLNSISSSLSSIDTIGGAGRRSKTKASADNLINPRSHSNAPTSLLWRRPKNSDRYSTNASGSRNRTNRSRISSDIYGTRNSGFTSYCFNSENAFNFILIPLLLLTITRQVFDFLGQIWLQILINFVTSIITIVALFGVRQRRISYLAAFSLWTLFNVAWNAIVFCIHTKIRDVGLNEDALSFYTGATSWWHSNGPGCLPYNISSIQPSISILQPNMITGCRIDYHLIEASQAAIHALLSLSSTLICCCVMSNVRRKQSYGQENHIKADKSYRLNNLAHDRSKVNQDPFPGLVSSRFSSNTASLRRANNTVSSRSSQHSTSSMRSARRRNRQSADGPTPRGSTSSAQRSQKYGSISSRRSNRKDRRSEISSLTYGTAGERIGTASQRTRLSSLSSADYLPSYQPPHSSSANLLSSYGEISSIDSYNNQSSHRSSSKNRQKSLRAGARGNTNPTYNGSRSSVCTNANNYDDLSYIYGNGHSRKSEGIYGPSTSSADHARHGPHIYQQSRSSTMAATNGFENDHNNNGPQQTTAEDYKLNQGDNKHNLDTMTRAKMTNGRFESFTANQQNTSRSQLLEEMHTPGASSNHVPSNYRGQTTGSLVTPIDNTSRISHAPVQNMSYEQQQIYSNQRGFRHPIYANNSANGNSETPM